MDINKVYAYQEKYQNAPKVWEQDYFNLAICDVIVSNYPKAKNLFNESMTRMFGDRPFWRVSAQPNWLVDIAILSGRSDLFPSVLKELHMYLLNKNYSVANSPMAHYCYSVMEILYPSGGNISEWIKDLIKRPKYKDLYAAGFALQAILDKDQSSFTNSLQLLLKAHEGLAKYGQLRLTPEGWICLPAMSLSFLAYQKNLKVDMENEYLPLGYLAYLTGG
jgi:hypothetical protein